MKLKHHKSKMELITWSNSLTFRPFCNNPLLNHGYSWSWGITKWTDIRSIIKSELKLDQIFVRHLRSTSKDPASSPVAASPEKSSHTKHPKQSTTTKMNLKTAKPETGNSEERRKKRAHLKTSWDRNWLRNNTEWK